MYKNRRKTISSQSERDPEYEAFKMNEFLNRRRRESLSSQDDVNRKRESLSSHPDLNSSEYSSSQRMLFATLFSNPDKRAKVLEFLTNEGIVPLDENIALNGQLLGKKKADRVKTLSQECSGSPVHRVQKKFKFESPSSRLRRLQLEELHKKENGSPKATPRSSKSSDDELSTPVPPDQILKGVVAYCEVRSGEEDRSELIKNVMQSMGAEVVDRLNSRKITHVVYRDGSYKTFERARLLNCKLVSVLWIEACRKKGRRVNESRYPALGIKAPEFDLTDVCGRLQDESESDSVSIITLSSAGSGVVPSSQNSEGLSHFSHANITADLSPRRSDDLGNQVRNSFELKKVQHIRSPDNLSISNKRASSVIDRRSSVIPDSESFALHITNDESKNRISDVNNETTDSKVTKRRKTSKSRQPSSVIDRRSSVIPDSESFALHLTNDESKSRISDANNETTDSKVTKRRKTSTSSKSNSSEVPIDDKNVTRRTRRSTSSVQSDKRGSSSSNKSTTNRKITEFIQSTSVNEKESSLNKTADVSSKDILSQTKSSIGSEKSLRLHISSDDSKSRCSAASNTDAKAVTVPDTTKTKENMTTTNENMSRTENMSNSDENMTTANANLTTINENTTLEPKKRRRLYNPNDDLDDMEIRWSQEPKMLDLPKPIGKYRVEQLANLKTPRNLTSNAKKYLQSKSTTSNSTSSDLSSTEKNKKEVMPKPVTNRRKSMKNTKTKLETSSELDENNKKIDNKAFDFQNSKVDLKKPSTRRSIRRIDSESSAEKKDDPVVDRRKSLRNATKTVKDQKKVTPVQEKNKSTSSDEYYSLNASKSDEEKEPEVEKERVKGASIRKKLYASPEVPKQKVIVNTPRRSTRISIMRTPSTDIQKKVIETPKSVGRARVVNTPKTLPRITKSTKITPLKKNISKTPSTKKNISKTPKSQKVKGTVDLDDEDEIPNSNVTRFLDKQISKEVWERRSTFEFELPNENKLKPTQKEKETKKYGTIVCTRLHRQQSEVFIAVVRRLGKFQSHEDEVTKNTTHLVAGDTGRTINLLRAIARGCWILKHEWLLRSAEAGKWLPEKDYELTDFSPAVQFSRMERSVFGKNYHMNILQGKNIWVTASSDPRKSDLKELIELVGGKVATAPRKADLVLGESMPPPAPTCLAEMWLLECISKYKFLPYDDYILQGPGLN